jgi:transcription elongation factor GreA
VGSNVTVRNESGKTSRYIITGSAEADPTKGRISNVSPIGKSLIGKKVGDIAEVNVPSGKIKLEILALK